MGKKKPKQDVTKYAMSIHFGICTGPVEYMSKLFMEEKPVWPTGGPALFAMAQTFVLKLMDFFGGYKQEGGLDGWVTWLPGNPDQVMPEFLAAKFGRTSATMPAYRGIASVFFSNYPGSDMKGYYWKANTPYLPGVWVGVGRASIALWDSYARIYRTATREKRITTNTGFGPVNNDLTVDVYGSTLVHYASDGTHIVVEDLRTGTVRRSIDVSSYQAVFVYISASRSEIIIPDTNNIWHVYDLTSGADKTTFGMLPGADLTPVGDSAGALNGGCTEIVVGSTTYMFQSGFHVLRCFANSGSGWAHIWSNSSGWPFSGDQNGVLAASPSWLFMRTASGACLSFNWNALGVIAYYGIDFAGMLGGGVNMAVNTTAVHCHWDAPTSSWFVIFSTDQLYTSGSARGGCAARFNENFTAIIARQDGQPWGNFSSSGMQVNYLRGIDGGTEVVFSDGSHKIYWVDVTTCQITAIHDVSEWGLGLEGYTDSGWSDAEQAFVVWRYFDMNTLGIKVLFMPWEFDSNPAHIIYECLTNPAWGMGAPSTAIDVANFRSVSQVLYNEGFGLSMIWTRSGTIEQFIGEVLDHIEATLFVNPRNGLLTLKLIRNDYDVASLPVFTPDNSVVTKFSRKLWGETINEIVVTWTNPDNENEETVVAQDLANIEAQGGVVSDGRNYYGVRNANLAMFCAQRDLRSAATPLAKCDIEINRTAWALLPGDCLKLVSSDDSVDQLIMRVGPVDYGKPGDPTVKVSLVEDVFSLALATYSSPPESLWEDTSEPPTPADYGTIITLPYYVVVNGVESSMLEGLDYPEVFAGAIVGETGHDTDTFELYGEETNAAGVTDFVDFGTKRIASRATLPGALPLEITSTILAFPDRTEGNGPIVGGLMIIQGTDETQSELCLVSDISTSGYQFKRGVLDTIPHAWPAGTPVWFVDTSMDFIDDVDIRSAGETVNYKFLTNTSQGTLDEGSAPVVSGVMTARPHLPIRPANVKVNGDNGFGGSVDCRAVDPVPVTWERRNRTTETTIILPWDGGDVTPETGQTTRVELLTTAGVLIATHAGLTGVTDSVIHADFAGNSHGYIRVSSDRDGLNSLQDYQILVSLADGILLEDTGLLLLETGDLLLKE